jgi:hypothetical protein
MSPNLTCPGCGAAKHINECNPRRERRHKDQAVRQTARTEWEENLRLERLVVPPGWDGELWLNYLADRTVYILRQVGQV